MDSESYLEVRDAAVSVGGCCVVLVTSSWCGVLGVWGPRSGA